MEKSVMLNKKPNNRWDQNRLLELIGEIDWETILKIDVKIRWGNAMISIWGFGKKGQITLFPIMKGLKDAKKKALMCKKTLQKFSK